MLFPTPLIYEIRPNYFFDFGALFLTLGLVIVFSFLQSISDDWQITILKRIESANKIEIKQNEQLDKKLDTILSHLKP